jgi:hypothetical protein
MIFGLFFGIVGYPQTLYSVPEIFGTKADTAHFVQRVCVMVYSRHCEPFEFLRINSSGGSVAIPFGSGFLWHYFGRFTPSQ